jgi:hypothetical protein
MDRDRSVKQRTTSWATDVRLPTTGVNSHHAQTGSVPTQQVPGALPSVKPPELVYDLRLVPRLE